MENTEISRKMVERANDLVKNIAITYNTIPERVYIPKYPMVWAFNSRVLSRKTMEDFIRAHLGYEWEVWCALGVVKLSCNADHPPAIRVRVMVCSPARG